jgi:hypothetical protein
MPRSGSSFTASTKAVSTAPAETTYGDQPLTSSALLPRPVLDGSPVEADQHGNNTLYSSTIVHSAQSMNISCYVFNKNSVLSEPLSRYLLVHSNCIKQRKIEICSVGRPTGERSRGTLESPVCTTNGTNAEAVVGINTFKSNGALLSSVSYLINSLFRYF